MTTAKFRKRTSTTSPDEGAPLLLVGMLLLLIPPAAAWKLGIWWLAILLAVPAAYAFAYWLFGRLLLVMALLRWRPRGIRGVLIYSESPVWQPHIEREWLPRLGARLVTLNWSARASWPNSLEVLLWRHFCGSYKGGTGFHRNFNPAAIVFQGLRHPLVFRFYGPFEAAKHGDVGALETLEQRLLEMVGG